MFIVKNEYLKQIGVATSICSFLIELEKKGYKVIKDEDDDEYMITKNEMWVDTLSFEKVSDNWCEHFKD